MGEDLPVKTKKKFPYEIKDVDEALNEKLLADCTGERDGFVQVGPKQWFLPSQYKKHAEIFYNFQPRPDDVWAVTFPRSGTTMVQEIIWLLANNLNYETESAINWPAKFPPLEINALLHPKVEAELWAENSKSPEKLSLLKGMSRRVWEDLEQTSQRRFIKTHLPFDLLSPNLLEVGCKVVYIARNPKDVAVSYYHLYRLVRLYGYSNNFSQFWDYFQKSLLIYGPFWSHINAGWERRNSKNLLFLFYEDITRDMNAALRKIAQFLGKNYSDEEFLKLEEHMRFDNFKKNSAANSEPFRELGIFKEGEQDFVRKGVTGGWKDYFPPDLNRRADKWIEENLKNTDLRFPEIHP